MTEHSSTGARQAGPSYSWRVVAGVIAVTIVACGYLLNISSAAGAMDSPWAMPMGAEWSLPQALLMVSMWIAMMTAMMLPSALPMLAAYDRAVQADLNSRRWSVAAFAAGYLLCWGLFAIAATSLQWLLLQSATVDHMGVLTHPLSVALALGIAGIYELTPIKRTMLGRCRTPMGFLATEWRDGRAGALRMGVAHGRSCLACCWALMGLLFVLGVMNLWWVLAIAALVALEKLTRSALIPRIAGVTLIAAAIAVLVIAAST